MVGRTIGKYRILEQIGRGGMGTVYKAVDETLDRTVAIKVLNADLLNQDSVERFRREAVMLARLNHPRIGAIHELTRDGHDLLMVMEFIGGETFERLVERLGTVTIVQACKLCIQVLEGLQYAHNAGVVHRDLKPANLIVMPSGDVKIMDFGIARMQGSEHLTSVGFMVGTPAYMSPEQVRGEEVDPRMDLYSIAVVLYRLLTHHLPFEGDTAIALIHSQLNNPPTPPRQFRADLPEWIVATLGRGLAKGRGDRFQTAEEFRAALEGGLTGTMPIPAILGPSAVETIGPTPTPPQMRIPVTPGPPIQPPGTPVPSPPPAAGATPNPVPIGATPPPASALPPSMIAAPPVPTPVSAAPILQTPPRPMTVPPGQTPAQQVIPATARAEATVTLRAPHLATAGVLLAVLVAGIAVLAVVALRPPAIVTQAPVVSTTQPATAVSPATSSVPEASTPAAGPASTPSSTPNVSSTTPTAVPPVTPPPAATAPRPTPTPAVTTTGANAGGRASEAGAGRSSDATAGEPARGRSTAAATIPTPPPAANTAASVSEAPAQHFPDVKALVVDGQRVREVDALLSLEPGNLIVRLRDEGTVLRTLPYRAITAATYARARRPRGQTAPNAAAVPENFGGSGFPLGNARHWLTLQTAAEFVVVRLEDRNVIRVLNGIETRTGLKVLRTDN